MSDETQSSGPASDTGKVLDGTALGALLTGSGAAAGFSDQLRGPTQAIADLEAASRSSRIRRGRRRAWRTSRLLAPMGVSGNAAAQIGRWAVDSGENNLYATLVAGAKQFQDLAQKLREDLRTYLQVEELNIPKASPGLPL